MLSTVFGFNGRINRLTWWMIQIFLLVCGLVINFVFQDNMAEIAALSKVEKPTPEQLKVVLGGFANSMLFIIVWGVLSNWLFLSSTVQRLHDRGSSGWRALFVYAPLALVFLAVYFLFQLEFMASFVTIVMAGIGSLITSVWLLVECGCLAGDDFSNEYGDPMGDASRRENLARELAEIRGEPYEPQISVAKSQPALAVAAPAPQMAIASGPRPFGRR